MSTPLPLGDTPSEKSSKSWIRWSVLAVVAAAVLLGVVIAWQQSQKSRIHAAVDEACREAVTEWAKYPGGVQFPYELEFDNAGDSSDIWTSEGVVDFPNGWGTPVRQDFSCIITVDGTEVGSPFAIVTSRDED